MYRLSILLVLDLVMLLCVWAESDEGAIAFESTMSDSNFDGSTVSPSGRLFNSFCLLPPDNGDGDDAVKYYYYDNEKQNCDTFIWTGKNGNQNRFVSVDECMEACHKEVGEATALDETDVSIIKKRSVEHQEHVLPISRCFQDPEPVKSKLKKNLIQRYFYSSFWNACFAYKSGSKNSHFGSRHECESTCKPADGSACGPNTTSVAPSGLGMHCSMAVCPKGYECLQGMVAQCCEIESRKEVDRLYSDKCEDGSNAAGQLNQYFLPIVAFSCNDLICESGHSCQRVGKNFAKCCAKGTTSKRDVLAQLMAPASRVMNGQGLLRAK